MNNQYKAPDSEIIPERVSSKKASLVSMISAIISSTIASFFVLGMFGFLISIINLFQAVQLYDTSDPKLMAGSISQALVSL